MTKPTLIDNVGTIIRRYNSHLESGDHVLREGSQQEIGHSIVDYFKEINPTTNQRNTDGYFVGPGGVGKTIILGDFIVGMNVMPNGRYVLGDRVVGKRALITVPTNSLVDQWGDRLLGKRDERTGLRQPSIFGGRFNRNNVGLYHAELTIEEKKSALSKAVVIMVHDSAALLHTYVDLKIRRDAPPLSPGDFDCVIIDEVDEKVRGDVTSKFYREQIFGKSLVIGTTATHLFRSGRTIGDYLFGGKKPICEITHLEGVKRKEIAPHINIIVQPEIDPSSIIKPRTKGWDDYSEAEQMRFIEQTGTDDALIEVIKVGRHPKTGKPLRDMTKLHQAVNIEHARHIVKKLNAAFGNHYAEAVWGETDEEMDDETRRLAKWLLETGDLKSVVQCKLWGRGTDIPPLEMTVQHAPTLSPNKLGQFHTRASRLHDGKKTAIYLSPYIEGINQLIIGEVLGGLYMIPDGYEFPPTEGRNNSSFSPDPWPDIRGVRVHYTERQLDMFAQERRRQRYVNGLPVKPKHMLSLDALAQTLDIDQKILHERVFAPLQEAYETRQAREKFVDVNPIDRNEFLHVRGKMFPVWRVGFYQHESQEVFCVDQNLTALCEHTLYGRLDKVFPELLDRSNVKRLLGCDDDQIEGLWQKLQHAFFSRKPYERHTEIDGIDFSYDNFGFYRNQAGASQFYLFPDALIAAYRNVYAANEKAAEKWATQPAVRQCKTSSWLTEAEVMDMLELNPLLRKQETAFIHNLFNALKRQSRSIRSGQEWEGTLGNERNGRVIDCSKRWLPLASPDNQATLCIHRSSLEWIKNELGMEGAYDAHGRANVESVRSASPSGLDL